MPGVDPEALLAYGHHDSHFSLCKVNQKVSYVIRVANHTNEEQRKPQ